MKFIQKHDLISAPLYLLFVLLIEDFIFMASLMTKTQNRHHTHCLTAVLSQKYNIQITITFLEKNKQESDRSSFMFLQNNEIFFNSKDNICLALKQGLEIITKIKILCSSYCRWTVKERQHFFPKPRQSHFLMTESLT